MECAKKVAPECSGDYYTNDKTCKACRRLLVKRNREAKIEYYREYDRQRFKNDPKVRERIIRYQATEAGKASAKKAKEKWASSNPIKRAAAIMVGNAVRDGRLNKPLTCSECGDGGKIHGHHDDYAKPLNVRWLCAGCHSNWHKENGPGKNAS